MIFLITLETKLCPAVNGKPLTPKVWFRSNHQTWLRLINEDWLEPIWHTGLISESNDFGYNASFPHSLTIEKSDVSKSFVVDLPSFPSQLPIYYISVIVLKEELGVSAPEGFQAIEVFSEECPYIADNLDLLRNTLLLLSQKHSLDLSCSLTFSKIIIITNVFLPLTNCPTGESLEWDCRYYRGRHLSVLFAT